MATGVIEFRLNQSVQASDCWFIFKRICEQNTLRMVPCLNRFPTYGMQ